MTNPTSTQPLEWPADPDDPFYDQFPNSEKAIGAFYMEDGDRLAHLDDRQLKEASEALIDAARLELTHGGSNDAISFLKFHDSAIFGLIKDNKKYDAVSSFYTFWKSEHAKASAHK
jgi:hypothetical protein